MPRFCANLTLMFPEVPFLDRFAEAAAAGFRAVEILFPYDEPAHEILARLEAHGLALVLINCPPPSYSGRPRGLAAVPGLEERFRQDFRRAVRYAGRLGAGHLHVMAGAAEGPEALATFIANLRWAAAEAPGQSLTVEPINRHDMPGYFLSDFDLAAEVLDAVAAPNLNLQFDAYHAQRIHGDALAVWRRHGHRAVHVQVAQTPARDEPGRGSPDGGGIDYPAFFAALDNGGYRGWVAGEYRPAGRTADGLGWMRG